MMQPMSEHSALQKEMLRGAWRLADVWFGVGVVLELFVIITSGLKIPGRKLSI